MSETRTYRGSSLEELLPRIRAELGDDAVVVRQREGLTGGVAGFFQKRTVEIEARRGTPPPSDVEWFAGEPEEEAVVTPSPRFTELPGQGAPQPPQPPAPEPEVVAAAPPAPEPVTPPPAPEPVAPPPGPQPPNSPFAAYLSAAAASPDPAPSPAGAGVPEAVPSARAGDAFPNAEELIRDAAGRAGRDAPEPPPAATEPPPAPEAQRPRPPVSVVPDPEPEHEAEPPREPEVEAPPPSGPVARPQAARHLIRTLTARGLDGDAAARIVDDALLHRLPLDPVASLPDAVAAQLAARVPVAAPSGPPARTLVVAGAPAAGGSRLVAGVAAAYATRTTVTVACVALRTADGGRGLAAALAPLGVPVHAADTAAQAAEHARALGEGALVLVDTPPVTPEDAPALAEDLAGLGPHELHLAVGGGGTAAAMDLLRALRPARIALGDPGEPSALGTALQVAMQAACPLTFVASTAAAGRPDLAVHPADAGALARALIG